MKEKKKKKKKQKRIKLTQWKAEDLPDKLTVTRYPYKPSVADIPHKPSGIVELFLDVVPIEHLVKQTVTYAVHRGNHSFSLASDEIKTLI